MRSHADGLTNKQRCKRTKYNKLKPTVCRTHRVFWFAQLEVGMADDATGKSLEEAVVPLVTDKFQKALRQRPLLAFSVVAIPRTRKKKKHANCKRTRATAFI